MMRKTSSVKRLGNSLVAFDGEHTASCNLHFDASDPHRCLVTDFDGAAKPWADLLNYLAEWADQEGIELSGWVDVQNRHISSFWKRGFAPRAVLVRREPQ